MRITTDLSPVVTSTGLALAMDAHACMGAVCRAVAFTIAGTSTAWQGSYSTWHLAEQNVSCQAPTPPSHTVISFFKINFCVVCARKLVSARIAGAHFQGESCMITSLCSLHCTLAVTYLAVERASGKGEFFGCLASWRSLEKKQKQKLTWMTYHRSGYYFDAIMRCGSLSSFTLGQQCADGVLIPAAARSCLRLTEQCKL